MSSTSGFMYPYTDDKYSYTGWSDMKDETLNSDIPDDGPALLLMSYDIVFVVSRSKFTSTQAAHRPFRFNRLMTRHP